MKSHHVLLSAFGLLGLIISYVIWNVGFFQPVLIEQVSAPSGVFVFKKHMGPYHEVGEVFAAVEKSMSEAQLACPQTFGLYYDDPNQAEHDRLRADIGCFLAEAPVHKPEGLEIQNGNSFSALRGTFDGAPWLTAFKVYRALERVAHEKKLSLEKGPVLEIYEKSPRGFRTQVYFKINN